jgi:hypothetical protein
LSKSIPTLLGRVLAVTIAASGLWWAIAALPNSTTIDALLDMEGHLLRFESFKDTAFDSLLKESASQDLSACDTRAQRALLLMEMPLAAAALHSGLSREFDQRVRSLEARTRAILGCAPRDSFAWLAAFNLEALHGELDDHAFKLLAMSYETSPNEAWISIRRDLLAVPLIASADEPVRRQVLLEFRQLVHNGLLEGAARAYLTSPPSIRSALQAQIDQLSSTDQSAIAEALRAAHS